MEAILRQGLPFLQTVPVFLRNSFFVCRLYTEFSGSFDLDRVAVTGNIVIYPKCMYDISAQLYRLLRLCQFYIVDLKRKFRRDHAKRADDPLQSLRTY